MEGGALDKACNELQALVSFLKPPKQLSKDVGESHTAHRLISYCHRSCYSVLHLFACTAHVRTVQVFFALVRLFPAATGCIVRRNNSNSLPLLSVAWTVST